MRRNYIPSQPNVSNLQNDIKSTEQMSVQAQIDSFFQNGGQATVLESDERTIETDRFLVNPEKYAEQCN